MGRNATKSAATKSVWTRGRALAGALVVLGAQSACTLTMYEKGNVRRVEVAKQSGESKLSASAYYADAGAERALHVRVSRASDVQLARTVRYNSIVWESHRDMAWPLWEVLELATSPLYLPIYLILVPVGIIPVERPYVHIPLEAKLELAFAPINPFVTTFGIVVERSEISDEEVFADKPVQLAYPVRLPARDVKIAWRALGAGGAELGKGEGTTDLFGEVIVPAIAGAEQVEVSGPGLPPTNAAVVR